MKPRKSLGQNFLTDPNVARKIVGALRAPEGAAVVEIGPGTGALTGLLHERFPDLTALEVDDRAVALLRERFPGLDVRHADVLDVDWAALAREKGRPLYVIGNLPYYITSEILFGLLDARRPPGRGRRHDAAGGGAAPGGRAPHQGLRHPERGRAARRRPRAPLPRLQKCLLPETGRHERGCTAGLFAGEPSEPPTWTRPCSAG
ncbi:MAG: hypothetical protein KatS3mg042_1784 [Rhodothermaceae bacterium]|nr:MAG: hypothetical protein KatS3mg042_1784 [Rhodothermaceae bacterium]